MKILSGVFFALLTALSTSAYAANANWVKSALHYTIYASGQYATMPFNPPSGVPSSGTSVTSVSFSWNHYPNGNTTEFVDLCYSAPLSSVIGSCINISAAQTGTTTAFNTKSAKGTFWIRHTITGGTYPANGNSISDSITVNYSF